MWGRVQILAGEPGAKIPAGQHLAEVGFAVEFELGEDAAHVGFDGVGRDDHFVGNFVVGVADAGEGRRFFFAVGEGFPEAEIFVSHVVFPQGKTEELIDRFTGSQALPHSDVDDKGDQVRIDIDPALAMQIPKALEEIFEELWFGHTVL